MRAVRAQPLLATATALSAAALLAALPPAAAATILPTPPNILPLVPLTATPSPMTLAEGASGAITFTFTDNTTTGVYLNVFKAINVTNPRSCGAECVSSALLDQTYHVIGPGQSYNYSVPVLAPLDSDAGPAPTKPSKSVVQGTIWWEYNLPGRGHLIYKQSTDVNVSVAEPPAAAVSALSRPSPAAVPEPATWALMLVGFGGLGANLRRRRAAFPG